MIEQQLGTTLDSLIEEYYKKLQEPTRAQLFRQKLEEITHKSQITVLRYVQGVVVPDALTQSVIAKELNTSASILFP
jgi:heterodisulfide reductase subunit A-like polyferredoxin